ncbi:hypothetical protein [Vibrio furnissii]|uniref:hypothetical protein n=1 Tax=Vibrio furnissii TaxID=29494 RepID=UPI0025730B4C|nr:hypothetical protein [Vibrio furnissii]WJG23677.1 hypothetical protein QSU95_21970 [Vibrio furnissii]
MSTPVKENKTVTQFYHALDKQVAAELTDTQKQAIEHAIKSVGLVHRHGVDVRKSLPWFGKRYYLVLLMGRDRRHQLRPSESKWANFVVTSLMIVGLLALLGLSFLALYLIKSAMGIDIFPNYSLGIWDWFKGLMQ